MNLETRLIDEIFKHFSKSREFLFDVFENALTNEVLDVGGEQIVLRVFGERDHVTLVAKLELAVVGQTAHVDVELFGRLGVLCQVDLVFRVHQRRFHVSCQCFRIIYEPLTLVYLVICVVCVCYLIN